MGMSRRFRGWENWPPILPSEIRKRAGKIEMDGIVCGIIILGNFSQDYDKRGNNESS